MRSQAASRPPLLGPTRQLQEPTPIKHVVHHLPGEPERSFDNGPRQDVCRATSARAAALTPESAARWPPGAARRGVAVSPDGQSVYVTNRSSSDVSQYDVGAGGALSPKSPATVSSPIADRRAVAVSPDGQQRLRRQRAQEHRSQRRGSPSTTSARAESALASTDALPRFPTDYVRPYGIAGEPGRPERLRRRRAFRRSAAVSQYDVGPGGAAVAPELRPPSLPGGPRVCGRSEPSVEPSRDGDNRAGRAPRPTTRPRPSASPPRKPGLDASGARLDSERLLGLQLAEDNGAPHRRSPRLLRPGQGLGGGRRSHPGPCAPSPSAPPRSGSRARPLRSPPPPGRRTTFRSPGPPTSIVRVTDFPAGAYAGSGVHTGADCTRSGDYTANCLAAAITPVLPALGHLHRSARRQGGELDRAPELALRRRWERHADGRRGRGHPERRGGRRPLQRDERKRPPSGPRLSLRWRHRLRHRVRQGRPRPAPQGPQLRDPRLRDQVASLTNAVERPASDAPGPPRSSDTGDLEAQPHYIVSIHGDLARARDFVASAGNQNVLPTTGSRPGSGLINGGRCGTRSTEPDVLRRVRDPLKAVSLLYAASTDPGQIAPTPGSCPLAGASLAPAYGWPSVQPSPSHLVATRHAPADRFVISDRTFSS